MNKRKKSRRIVSALLVLVLLMLSGCTGISSHRTVQRGASPEQSTSGNQSLTGVVVANDISQGQVTLQELGSEIQTTLRYNATSMITDKYGTQITGEELDCGLIMEAEFETGSVHITNMVVPEDAWEYQEVKKFAASSQEKSFQVAGKKYQYSDLTYIEADGKNIQMMELNKQDVLTVRGCGYTVYSIVCTKGHGYIRLTNYGDFIGGMVEVGNGIILPISKNMLITAREGVYRVLLTGRSVSAVKTVTVRSGEETVVDFSDYQSAEKNVGQITFQIEPAGADLTINGTPVDYSKPISLSYGTYRIGLTMNGYEDYTGILEVAQASDTIYINLVDKKAQVVNDATASPGVSDSELSDTVTRKIDSDHTITVSAPEGAEVYLDNVYKGLAPCTFTKIIGSQTITFRKDGYITKSYSVDILDDSENVSLTFSELAESAEESEAGSTATTEP